MESPTSPTTPKGSKRCGVGVGLTGNIVGALRPGGCVTRTPSHSFFCRTLLHVPEHDHRSNRVLSPRTPVGVPGSWEGRMKERETGVGKKGISNNRNLVAASGGGSPPHPPPVGVWGLVSTPPAGGVLTINPKPKNRSQPHFLCIHCSLPLTQQRIPSFSDIPTSPPPTRQLASEHPVAVQRLILPDSS